MGKMAKNYTHRQSPSPGTFTAGINLLPGSALVLAVIDCVTVFDSGLPGIIIYRSNLFKRTFLDLEKTYRKKLLATPKATHQQKEPPEPPQKNSKQNTTPAPATYINSDTEG